MSEESVKNDIKISINYMIPGKYNEKEIIEALNNDIDFVEGQCQLLSACQKKF